MASAMVRPDIRDEVLDILDTDCLAIHEAFRTLSDILDRHSGTLSRAWAARNQKKQRKLLKTVWSQQGWGEMPHVSRPDINESQPQRHHFVWPYLTQEDLAGQTDTLLTFICNRTVSEPNDFTLQDLYSTRGGWPKPVFAKSISVVPKTKGAAIIVTFQNAQQSLETGRHYVLEEYILGSERAPDALNFQEALLVAEVQKRIYTFLVEVCFSILQPTGILKVDFDNEDLHPKVEGTLMGPGPVNVLSDGVDVLYKTRRLAFYGPPAAADFNSLGRLLNAKFADAKTSLQLLREHPGFYEAAVLKRAHPNPTAHEHGRQKPSREDDEDNQAIEEQTTRNAIQACIIAAIQNVDWWDGLNTAFANLEGAVNGTTPKTGFYMEMELLTCMLYAQSATPSPCRK